MSLTKLIDEIWNDERVKKLRLKKNEVKVVFEVALEVIKSSLLLEGIVKMQGLFTLKLKKSKGRRIRNPQTKEIMYSKDHYKISVIPSENMKRKMREIENKN